MKQCKICGKWFKRVCRHVCQAHGMSAREYKKMFGYDVKRGIMSEERREHMRQQTLANGSYKHLLTTGVKSRFKKGHKYNYVRSAQTLKRLRSLGARTIRENSENNPNFRQAVDNS